MIFEDAVLGVCSRDFAAVGIHIASVKMGKYSHRKSLTFALSTWCSGAGSLALQLRTYMYAFTYINVRAAEQLGALEEPCNLGSVRTYRDM
jgi:hypothetical protein